MTSSYRPPKIDISKVGLFILATDGYINAQNLLYLSSIGMSIPHQLTVLTPKAELVTARNLSYERVIKAFVDASRFEWYLFMDKDNYFQRGVSDEFFTDTDADVVGCHYDFDHNRSWVRPDEFHMGCVRVRQEALEQLQLPLWGITHNKTKTQITDCDCGFFRRKLLQIGAKIERRGKCGHDNQQSWYC